MKRIIILALLSLLIASQAHAGFGFGGWFFGFGQIRRVTVVTESYYLLSGGTDRYAVADGSIYQVASH